MYGTPPRSTELAIRIELATGDEEPALLSVPAAMRAGAEDDSRLVIGTLPIAALEPGDYIVRAIVSVDGRPAGRILRTLRKVRS